MSFGLESDNRAQFFPPFCPIPSTKCGFSPYVTSAVVVGVAAGSKCKVSPYREPSSSGMRQTLDSEEISTLINYKLRFPARENDGEA